MGNRPYGYTGNGQAIIEEEAEIVREVFRRYLDGESPLGTQDLTARGVTTSEGKTWQPENVRHLLSSNFVARRWVPERGPPSSIRSWRS
ncbi:recombinase family protein [Streptomyces mirabilis]